MCVSPREKPIETRPTAKMSAKREKREEKCLGFWLQL